MRRLWRWGPIVVLAAALALLQWLSGGRVTGLWWQTVAVAVAVACAVGLAPWSRWLFRPHTRSPWLELSLFASLVRHFALLLQAEARRALLAHRLAAPLRYRSGWFDSLRWLLIAYFRRVWIRAERMYASLLVRL